MSIHMSQKVAIRIALGDREVQCHKYAEESDFDAFVGEGGVDSLLLGEDAETERAYYVVTVSPAMGARSTVRIGIVCELDAIAPQILLRPNNQDIWIGFNRRVVSIDTNVPAIQHALDLDSTFYCFYRIGAGSVTLLFHETGIVAISDGWERIWSVATEVICGAELSPDEIRLEFAESEPVVLHPSTGRRL